MEYRSTLLEGGGSLLFIVITFLSFAFTSTFMLSKVAFAQEQTENKAKTFFCDTRYSKKIDSSESQRKTACQNGYDGKGCGEGSDDEKEACEAGARADRPIPSEPDDEQMDKLAELDDIDPPVTTSDSVSGSARCGSVDTAYISCPGVSGGGIDGSPVWGLVTVLLNIAVALVGLIAVGAVVYTGVIYSSAAGDEAKVRMALTMLKNIMIGTVVFASMYVLLQFIVPGGIFR